MGPCTNKTGHNNNFVVVSPCWRHIKASGVRPLWLCFGIHWTAYWVFPEKFTFLSEISPPRHQDCICSDLSQTWARLWRAQRSPLLYHQQRNTWLLLKIPSFYDSYATTCSACSHIRVSGESLNKAALFAVCPFAMISHKGPCLQLSPAWLPASFKLCELMPAQGVLLSPQVSQQGEVKVENGTAGDTMLLTSWVRMFWLSVALQTPAGTASGKVCSAEEPQPCCTEKGAGRSRSSHFSLTLQCPWSTSAWSQLRTLRQDPELVFLNVTPVTFS